MRRRRLAVLIAVTALAVPVHSANRIVLHVDAAAVPGGDGSGRYPYRDLQDAVAAANAESAPVTINVRPGSYLVSTPIKIECAMDLHGATELVEGSDGWPTGAAVPGTETRIVAANPSVVQSLITVGREDGTAIDGVSIRGFVFSGSAGAASELLVTRVQHFDVTANIFRAPGFSGIQTIASSGRATANHFSGMGAAGAIFAGGYPASPSSVVVTGNRSVHNTNGGVLLNGASITIPDLGDRLDAVVRGNDLSDNASAAVNNNFGLRLFILRRDPGEPGDTQFSAHIHALVQANRMVGNVVGVSIDAGFPYRVFNGVCDNRVYTGNIDVTLLDNTVSGNQRAPGLLTFTRNAAALSPSMRPLWQYLHSATFTIDDPDGTLANALVDNPAADPFVGPCAGDATHESLGNVLLYNGVGLNGRNF